MKFFIVPTILLGAVVMAQSPTPGLSTSDKVAISTLEQQKQGLQKQFSDAQQQEQTIVQEWNHAHPGYHLNPQNFSIEADPKPEAAKPAEPKK